MLNAQNESGIFCGNGGRENKTETETDVEVEG